MRKRVGVLLGLAIVVIAVAATAQAGTRGAKVTNVTLAGWSSGPDEDSLLNQVIGVFNKTHPTIHADFTVINGDYPTAMTARFAAHNPPDVFYVDSSVAGAWANQGVMQPLNGFVKSSKYDTSAFFPSLLGAFEVGKTIYGFPKDWSPLAMEVNKGLAATPTQLGVGWCGEALGKGKAAIIFEGNWLLPFMKSTYPSVQYGIFPMVKGKTGGNLAFTVSYSMAKDSPNKQAAWTLLSWLTSKQGQTIWMSKGLALPSRKDVKAIGGRQAFLGAAPFAHGWGFGNPNFANAYTVMNNDLTAVIAGSKSVAAMLSDVASALKG